MSVENPETIEEFKAQAEALNKQLGELKPLAETAKTSAEKLAATEKALAESEAARKAQGQNFKKLRDMTDAEKAKLSEAEQNILKRQDELEEQRASDEAQRANDRLERALDKIVGQKKELRDAVIAEYNNINGEKKTQAQVDEIIKKAAKIHGIGIGADPLRNAHNSGGSGAQFDNSNGGFADTERGKALGNMMGLTMEPPKK